MVRTSPRYLAYRSGRQLYGQEKSSLLCGDKELASSTGETGQIQMKLLNQSIVFCHHSSIVVLSFSQLQCNAYLSKLQFPRYQTKQMHGGLLRNLPLQILTCGERAWFYGFLAESLLRYYAPKSALFRRGSPKVGTRARSRYRKARL